MFVDFCLGCTHAFLQHNVRSVLQACSQVEPLRDYQRFKKTLPGKFTGLLIWYWNDGAVLDSWVPANDILEFSRCHLEALVLDKLLRSVTNVQRSEERGVGNECVRTCMSRCSPYHIKTK